MIELGSGDALLLVDVQRDFCPGGALPIPQGDRVVPVLNRWLRAARAGGVPVIASRDWHPPGHPSFREQGGPWPPHCLQDSEGARFHADLELPPDAFLVSKGTRYDRDQLSAFDETGLAALLGRLGIRRLFVGGLALDVCVLATALDAVRAGFAVRLAAGGALPVTEPGGRAAREQLRAAGVEEVAAPAGGAA
jgi:nicotinamidase/pyrazinamidase